MEKFEELPDHVKRYSELHYRKKKILADLKEVNESLKAIDAQLMNELSERQSGIFEINPTNPEEQDIYGPYGAIQVKTSYSYENLGTKDPLAKGCIAFFRHLFPTVSEEEVTKLGYGQMEWLWSNRNKKTVHAVERIYAEEKEKTRSKRKAPPKDGNATGTDTGAATPSKAPEPKKNKVEKPKDMPKTTQDFMNLDCVNALSHHLQPVS